MLTGFKKRVEVVYRQTSRNGTIYNIFYGIQRGHVLQMILMPFSGIYLK